MNNKIKTYGNGDSDAPYHKIRSGTKDKVSSYIGAGTGTGNGFREWIFSYRKNKKTAGHSFDYLMDENQDECTGYGKGKEIIDIYNYD